MLNLRTRWEIISTSDVNVCEYGYSFMRGGESVCYHVKAIVEASVNRKRRRCRAYYYDLSGHRQKMSIPKLIASDVSLIQVLTENGITV